MAGPTTPDTVEAPAPDVTTAGTNGATTGPPAAAIPDPAPAVVATATKRDRKGINIWADEEAETAVTDAQKWLHDNWKQDKTKTETATLLIRLGWQVLQAGVVKPPQPATLALDLAGTNGAGGDPSQRRGSR